MSRIEGSDSMASPEVELPENTLVKIAVNASIQIRNSVGNILMPLYVDRTATVIEPRGTVKFHIPLGLEIPVTIEIPFNGNLTNMDISLSDANKILRKVSKSISGIYGVECFIEDTLHNGLQIKVTGKYCNK